MTQTGADQIKQLIEQTGDAYAIFAEMHQANTDYAEFAAQAIAEFRSLLGTPELTPQRLSQILRSGSYRHRDTDPTSCWSTFLAGYVRDASNGH
ncbi:MAG: hypothetical protein LRZ85_02060 [Alphaproteobacteria bacterium]|nr:hypothetical protein [Alphaproteobacteria bacterium]MCD8519878.1 hypothetical protein [Alphaproteobacteria bacterium]MCD8525744.1 hypothetical protein [Alphaproteobacteria bacterium]MCD8571007.1 hypothetical protein [Alphaproteobacteria bacterium]